jgi:hypothetical protein
MVRYLTTNGISNTYGFYDPFALRYRRVNETFYESINIVMKTCCMCDIVLTSLFPRCQRKAAFKAVTY